MPTTLGSVLVLTLFQSPSLRGSGRFTRRMAGACGGAGAFQSPSLRGSGRFWVRGLRHARHGEEFQSPSLRGSGRFVHSQPPRRRAGRKVSIPFIAGQWSLHADEAMNYAALAARFNPLHCGAVVASGADRDLRRGGGGFQSPSLRGSGRFAAGSRAPRCEARRFNPLHCGAVVASLRSCARGWKQPPSFNPLHCGAVVASGVRFRR